MVRQEASLTYLEVLALYVDNVSALVFLGLQVSLLDPLLELTGRGFQVVLLKELDLSVVEVLDVSTHHLEVTVHATTHKVHHTDRGMSQTEQPQD